MSADAARTRDDAEKVSSAVHSASRRFFSILKAEKRRDWKRSVSGEGWLWPPLPYLCYQFAHPDQIVGAQSHVHQPFYLPVTAVPCLAEHGHVL
jgi:hypothetical protein